MKKYLPYTISRAIGRHKRSEAKHRIAMKQYFPQYKENEFFWWKVVEIFMVIATILGAIFYLYLMTQSI